jgi:hypothetical protein
MREFFKVHKNTRCSEFSKNAALETASTTVAFVGRHNLIMEALLKAHSFIHNLFISLDLPYLGGATDCDHSLYSDWHTWKAPLDYSKVDKNLVKSCYKRHLGLKISS